MMKGVPIATNKVLTSDTSVGKAREYAIKSTTQCMSATKLSGGETPATLNRVLYMPPVEHSFDFVSSLCADNRVLHFTNRKRNVKKKNCVVGVGHRGAQL